MKTRLVAALFAGVTDLIPAPGVYDDVLRMRLYDGSRGNKHSRHTVAQDKRAAAKRRNKLRAKR